MRRTGPLHHLGADKSRLSTRRARTGFVNTNTLDTPPVRWPHPGRFRSLESPLAIFDGADLARLAFGSASRRRRHFLAAVLKAGHRSN